MGSNVARSDRSTGGNATELPHEITPRRVALRGLEVVGFLAVLVLIAALAPGLGEVRRALSDADLGWIVLGIAFELLSCVSYVLMFGPIFCRRMSWRTSWEIGWAELGVGSIVPASGAAGVALGAWVLGRRGMPAERIARRSVAFLLIKSSVNFIAVAILGALMAAGLIGPHQSLLLTALPAVLAAGGLALVLAVPRLGPGEDPPPDATRPRRWLTSARRAIITGTGEALEIFRSRDPRVVIGAVGYWAWDNAVLWATFHAVGASVPLSVVLMGYLIGQLGGLLPIPGGVGGIDGGLIGTLVVYGTPAGVTVAAVLAYRLILFWLPLVGGIVASVSLRRGLRDMERRDLHDPARA
ncbi:MAG: putative heme transporter [Solirubrobacteraceae bacterium]|nr:putative heme transporter [Solirubrobacteraceae bacterium]